MYCSSDHYNHYEKYVTWLPGSTSHRTAFGHNFSSICTISAFLSAWNQSVLLVQRSAFGHFLPSGFYLSAFHAGPILGNLTMWPINCTLRSAINLFNGIIAARWKTFLFITQSCHLMLMMFLRQHCWKTSTFWLLVVVLSHVLLAKVEVDTADVALFWWWNF